MNFPANNKRKKLFWTGFDVVNGRKRRVGVVERNRVYHYSYPVRSSSAMRSVKWDEAFISVFEYTVGSELEVIFVEHNEKLDEYDINTICDLSIENCEKGVLVL